MTAARVVLVVVAAAVGFVVGFYAGFFALLSVVGLEDFRGWQFELATVPAGGLVAGVAAAASSPSPRRWARVVGAALAAALVVTGGLNVVDGDFGIAMGLGGPLVVGTAVLAASTGSAG